MRNLDGKVVAITGAGSGIGRALALKLAKMGCRLALSDVDAAGLERIAGDVGALGAPACHHAVDVSDRDAVFRWAEDVVVHHGEVNVIINNAGIALVGMVGRMSHEDFRRIMDVDFWGVVHGTDAFLPHLQRSGAGHIVNISSVFGLISLPTQSAYNAAKFAVRGFTEALRQELDMTGSCVSSTCVHPGGINTEIAKSAKMDDVDELIGSRAAMLDDFHKRRAKTSPATAAAVIIGAVQRDQRRVLIGADAKVIDVIQRLLPSGYQSIGVVAVKRMAARAAS